MLPEFFVIGAQKAGSTYLLRCLGDHPQIFMPPAEVAFFEDPFYSADRISEFEKHFKPARPGQVLGVKRPDVLGIPVCPERMHRHMPNLKIVAILRHPIDRAVSGYFHYMKTGMLPIVPVEEGLPKILDGEYSKYPRAQDVLEFGLYGKYIQHFEKYFPRERIHVILLEDMKQNAEVLLAELYGFLNVATDFHPQSFDSRPMKAPYSMTRLKLWNMLDRYCRKWTPDGTFFLRSRGPLAGPISAINKALDTFLWERLFSAKRPKLSPELQRRLVEYYSADAKCLETWLGRPLTGWSDLTEFKSQDAMVN
jgi:hypothetical protein